MAERLSVAFLSFSRDGTGLGLANMADPEWVAQTSIPYSEWVYAGHSHVMPDYATLLQAIAWVEQAVSQRRALAARFPATRIASAVSRQERARMELDDAKRRLAHDPTVYSGLMQLEGVCQRWPDLSESTEARRLLDEYAEREDRPWESQMLADRRRAIEAEIRRLDQRVSTLRRSEKYKQSRRRVDYRHEYAEMEWVDSPSPDATSLSSRTEYDEATQAVLTRLGSRVSLDRHRRVAMVNLRGTRVTAAQFRHFKKQLQGMTDLRALDLSHTVMPEYVLSQVADLANLQALNLSGTDLTSGGMRHLSQLEHLQFLAVTKTSVSSGGFRDLPLGEMRVLIAGDTNVTDQLLEQLSEAANLQRLSVYSTRITSGGLAKLIQLPSLTYLNLGSTRIGDAACSSLSQMTALEELILDNTAVSDKGLSQLTVLRNLRRLSVKGTRVTDDVLTVARQMERLESLNLKATSVSEHEIDELRRSLSCEVIWDDEIDQTAEAERQRLHQELRSLGRQEPVLRTGGQQ